MPGPPSHSSRRFASRAEAIEPFLAMEILERAEALEREGAQVYVDRSLFTRLMYLLHMHKQATRDRRGLYGSEGRLRHYLAYLKKRGVLDRGPGNADPDGRRIPA